MNIYNSHRWMRMACVGICLAGVIIIFAFYVKIQYAANTELSDITVKSVDGAIDIRWDAPNFIICNGVRVTISDGKNVVHEIKMPPLKRHLSYKNGEHGRLYTVSLTAEYKDGTLGETNEKQVLFLNYENLPDLPIMAINTVNGEEPTYEEAAKPDEWGNYWGGSITNNEYVAGEMLMYGTGMKSIFTGMKIRIRGNSSNLIQSKNSYKINLDSPYPLLADDDISCRGWCLLNNGVNLNTYVGDYVGDLCGMEWQPHMMFVNVILNGDWKGCYCLAASVGIDTAGSNVSDSGYIFENDVYWWSGDGPYFRTEGQIEPFAYTFKYPFVTSPEDGEVLRIKEYMQEFENYILSGDERYKEYIDEESFARWILVRDIMGNGDGGGSNMYFYKYGYDENNPTSSKVKMGPLWDFDAAFIKENIWSSCRGWEMSYFHQLFRQDTFYGEYLNMWLSVAPDLNNQIDEMLCQLEVDSGDAIDESWKLDAARWGNDIESFAVQKENISCWFKNRVAWMNWALRL